MTTAKFSSREAIYSQRRDKLEENLGVSQRDITEVICPIWRTFCKTHQLGESSLIDQSMDEHTLHLSLGHLVRKIERFAPSRHQSDARVFLSHDENGQLLIRLQLDRVVVARESARELAKALAVGTKIRVVHRFWDSGRPIDHIFVPKN